MRVGFFLVPLALLVPASSILEAAPQKHRPAPNAAKPLPSAAPPPPTIVVPEPPLVPLVGCPAPAAGALPVAAKVDKKARGKFSIDKAPYISGLDPHELCANNQKARSGVDDSAGGLGLSAQVMNTRSARLDLIALPAVELELRPVLEAFARAWPYAPLERTPRILFRADEAYQAQALPDNTIVVSLGLLEAAQSDSEVLFVLAHEYSHLLLGHFTKAETISAVRNSAKAASMAYQAGSFMNSMRHSDASNIMANAQSSMDASARHAAPVAEALRFAVDDIFATSWNRDQENQADALAIDLLIGGNMTIDSYANVFARLQKAFETEKNSRDKRVTAAQAAQSSMEQAMKGLANSSTVTGIASGGGIHGLGSSLFKSVGSALFNNMGSITKSIGGDTHLPPEERRNGLAAYFQAGYPKADPPIDTGALIARIKAKPDFRRAIVLRTAYFKARNAYFAQDFGAASEQLRALGAGTRTAPTFVNYVAGLNARDQGNSQSAAAYFDAARNGNGVPNLQLYESYAELEIGAHDAARADTLIAEGKTRFRDPDHFRSIEIKRDIAVGDTPGAQVAYTSCMAVKGRDYIVDRCKAAMPNAGTGNPLGLKLPFGG